MNGVKETVIKHDTYDFFNDMINIKILDAKKKYFYSLYILYTKIFLFITLDTWRSKTNNN